MANGRYMVGIVASVAHSAKIDNRTPFIFPQFDSEDVKDPAGWPPPSLCASNGTSLWGSPQSNMTSALNWSPPGGSANASTGSPLVFVHGCYKDDWIEITNLDIEVNWNNSDMELGTQQDHLVVC